jgi:hypothetical protein
MSYNSPSVSRIAAYKILKELSKSKIVVVLMFFSFIYSLYSLIKYKLAICLIIEDMTRKTGEAH